MNSSGKFTYGILRNEFSSTGSMTISDVQLVILFERNDFHAVGLGVNITHFHS
jgi:hypothetical protein